MPCAYVDDLGAHFAHAKASSTAYRAYTAEDLEGRRWTFPQARPTTA
jgi:hypothetical protein